MRIRTLVLAGILAGGCARHPPSDGVIDFDVSGGFSGGGDGTSLHIDADGTAARTTLQNGAQTTTLDRATLDDIRRKIDDAEFPALKPLYDCQCADDFVYHLSVPLGGTTYQVDVDASAEPPARLRVLIDTVRDIIHRPLDWH